MKRYRIALAAGLASLLAAGSVWAGQPIVYPAKGQNPQQQQRDEGECHVWAKNNTGVDPAVVAQQPAPAPSSSVGGGERVRGAGRGALGGAAIDAHLALHPGDSLLDGLCRERIAQAGELQHERRCAGCSADKPRPTRHAFLHQPLVTGQAS